MAKVSVVIPAHNPKHFLRPALQSVHQQTFSDWELVVIDDHSTEDLAWVTQEFPRVRLIRQAHGGVSVARNNGILSTSGEYIAFMDQDDLWRPRKLAHQVQAMDADTEVAICFCDLELFHDVSGAEAVRVDTGEMAPWQVELDGTSGPAGGVSALHRSARFFASRFVVPSTVMLRRRFLATSGLLDPFIPFSGDFDLDIKLGARHRVAHLASVDVLYRKHANNFSDQYQVGRTEVQALISRYTAYATAKGDKALARDARHIFGRPSALYAAQAVDCARRSLKQRQFAATAQHLLNALWFNPPFLARSLYQWLKTRRPPPVES